MLYRILTTPHWTLNTVIQLFASFVAVALAITIHEYAHARSAKSYGDDTAEKAGRLSLNPAKHYDPIGSTLFLLFGFGWAKPVPVRPYLMRHPRFDGMRSALWGPLSNILFALACGLVLRFVPGLPEFAYVFLLICITLNLFLAIFNLIPLPPLDGSRIWTYFLPDQLASRFERFAQQYGFIVLIVLLWFPGSPIMRVVDGITNLFIKMLLGTSV